MLFKPKKNSLATGIFLLSILFYSPSFSQLAGSHKPSVKPSLGLENGVMVLRAGNFQLELVKASQTVVALRPDTLKSFDFTPGENLEKRSGDGSFQLGDIDGRLRIGRDTNWHCFSSAAKRAPVKPLRVAGNVLAGADLAPTLPSHLPLTIERYWEKTGKDLILHFILKNKTKEVVEIGALGIPVIFDNILQGRSLEVAHAKNVLYDPYIGMDAGYLQVTRLSGRSPSLLVLPYDNTPFEAYNPLPSDPLPRDVVFEGFYEWMIYSKAYADRDWKNIEPWNTPHSAILKPGQHLSVGLRLVLSGKAEDTQRTLAANGRPVAVSIPGYVIPQDVNSRLFLKYRAPIKNITIYPKGGLSIHKTASTKHGWQAYEVKGNTWGRVRLSITYADGLNQSISYKVIKPEAQVIQDYGRFLNTHQWLNHPDTFHRSPSYITYDYEMKRQVTQDERVWVAGLSDEAGAGSWLGASMKQMVLPDEAEVVQLEAFVDSTLWGKLQYLNESQQYGVRKSLFYYDPSNMPKGTYSDTINYKTWGAWNPQEAASVGRSYNYPHVAAAYWALYRIARYHQGLVKSHNWQWFLKHAYETAMGMVNLAPEYTQFGLMEGSVFYFILKDMKTEGMLEMADTLEAAMKKRALHWRTLQYPFGSEMPWDSTGQEEVYVWSTYFGFDDKAKTTLSAILAYMPVVPHWAYNGNARRYWDFGTAGKISRIERMVHHYGSGLNAIPVLEAYRQHPNDFYLLQVGYGGLMGSIANINQDGFAPCAFHAFPKTLKDDAYSGDYGSGFYGYSVNTATYLVNHPEFGWLAFGGNLEQKADVIEVRPTTAMKARIYISELGLSINFNAGAINKLRYDTRTKKIILSIDPADTYTSNAFFQIENGTDSHNLIFKPTKVLSQKNGIYELPLLKGENATLELTPTKQH